MRAIDPRNHDHAIRNPNEKRKAWRENRGGSEFSACSAREVMDLQGVQSENGYAAGGVKTIDLIHPLDFSSENGYAAGGVKT